MPTTPKDVTGTDKQKYHFKNCGPLAQLRGDGRDFVFKDNAPLNELCDCTADAETCERCRRPSIRMDEKRNQK